jgi:hypothetical protein
MTHEEKLDAAAGATARTAVDIIEDRIGEEIEYQLERVDLDGEPDVLVLMADVRRRAYAAIAAELLELAR